MSQGIPSRLPEKKITKGKLPKKKRNSKPNIGGKPQNAPIDFWGMNILNVLPGHP